VPFHHRFHTRFQSRLTLAEQAGNGSFDFARNRGAEHSECDTGPYENYITNFRYKHFDSSQHRCAHNGVKSVRGSALTVYIPAPVLALRVKVSLYRPKVLPKERQHLLTVGVSIPVIVQRIAVKL
jgi:hypothetical protein